MKEENNSAVPVENRRLAAIMFTDIVGFSRQMGRNEAHTLRLLDTHNQIIHKAVIAHHGTVIKTVGDAFLVDFPSVVHAVQGAQQIQAQFRTHNTEQEPAEQIHVRIGIHLGDIVQKEGDVFGDGVNIAKRLQELAEPDSICLSQVVYQEVEKKLSLGTVVSLGQAKLKNIDQRFPVYMLASEHADGVRQTLQARGLHLIRRMGVVSWMAAALFLIAGAVIAAWYLSLPRTSPPQSSVPSTQATPAALPLPDKPSIVVLPFSNLSNDPEQEYFSDGITEDLTSDLSKISSLLVIARNSAFTYKGKAVKVQEISKELGVRYILEGSVRKADNHVRITAQLIDATTGGHLWSERYDRPLKDIFALQDEIVAKIVTTLKLQLTLREQGILVRKTTNNLEAYDYFLRGTEYTWRFTKDTNSQARQLFEKAVKLDPGYAAAYASLGWTYFIAHFSQWDQDPQALERAFILAQQAVTLDESLPAAHMLLSRVYLDKKQYEQAIAEAERANTLAPNNASSYWTWGVILNFTGQAEKAIGVLEQALRLDPYSPIAPQLTLGWAYLLTGRYDEAIATQRKVLSRNRNLLDPHLILVISYSELGRKEEAQAEAAEVQRVSPTFSLEVVRQTWPYKNPADMERTLAGLRKAGLK